jgi:hypothetical protein
MSVEQLFAVVPLADFIIFRNHVSVTEDCKSLHRMSSAKRWPTFRSFISCISLSWCIASVGVMACPLSK